MTYSSWHSHSDNCIGDILNHHSSSTNYAGVANTYTMDDRGTHSEPGHHSYQPVVQVQVRIPDFVEISTGSFISFVHGDGQAAASRAARGLVGGRSGAFNLSLVMRQLLGAGTPRELKNSATRLVLHIFRLLTCRNRPKSAIAARTTSVRNTTAADRSIRQCCRIFWKLATSTTGC